MRFKCLKNVTLIVFYTVFAKIKKPLHIKYLPRAECETVWSVRCHASSLVLCCGQIPFTGSERGDGGDGGGTSDQMMLLSGGRDTCRAEPRSVCIAPLSVPLKCEACFGVLCAVCGRGALRQTHHHNFYGISRQGSGLSVTRRWSSVL